VSEEDEPLYRLLCGETRRKNNLMSEEDEPPYRQLCSEYSAVK